MNKPRAMQLTTGARVDAGTYEKVRASLRQMLPTKNDGCWMNRSAVGQAFAVLKGERQNITDGRFVKILRDNNFFKKGSSETLGAQDVFDEETRDIILASVQLVQRHDRMPVNGTTHMKQAITSVDLVENPVHAGIAGDSVRTKPRGLDLRK